MTARAFYYRTKAGSRVTVTPGKGWTCDFDWFEEGACIEASRCVDADTRRPNDAWLHFACDCCGSRAARLFKCDDAGNYDVAALVEALS